MVQLVLRSASNEALTIKLYSFGVDLHEIFLKI